MAAMVMERVLPWLDPESRFVVSLVCKDWSAIAMNPSYWVCHPTVESRAQFESNENILMPNNMVQLFVAKGSVKGVLVECHRAIHLIMIESV